MSDSIPIRLEQPELEHLLLGGELHHTEPGKPLVRIILADIGVPQYQATVDTVAVAVSRGENRLGQVQHTGDSG